MVLIGSYTDVANNHLGTAEELAGRPPEQKLNKYLPVIIKSMEKTKIKNNPMRIKKSIGRPPKVDLKTINRLADALQHSATVSDACRYACISRDTYYRYMKNQPLFTEKMNSAKANQYTVVFSSLTTYQ